MNIPQSPHPRVVVIGGGFGGLKLLKALQNKKCQAVLIDKNNYHCFQPLLYQVATAGLEPDSIAHAIRTLFKKNEDFHFRIGDVKQIDTKNNKIISDIGELEYDILVLATGSQTNFFGNQNIMEHAMPMKTIPEALNLRSVILQNLEAALLTDDLNERERLMNFVIVGGGPTGVELAGALAELKNHILPHDYPDLDIRRMSVHLVQAGTALLPGMSEKAQKTAAKYLEDMDVELWFNTRVLDYNGKDVKTDNKDLQATTLIWAAGVKGHIIQGLDNGKCIEHSRLLVDEFSRVKAYDNIFAIGDVALMQSENSPKGHPMLAQVAMQQGQLLGKNLVRKVRNQKLVPFKYNDKGSMATIGRNKAVVDLKFAKFSGLFAWMVWMFVHLVSLVGFRNKIVALANWVVQYFSYNKSVRLIIRPYKK